MSESYKVFAIEQAVKTGAHHKEVIGLAESIHAWLTGESVAQKPEITSVLIGAGGSGSVFNDAPTKEIKRTWTPVPLTATQKNILRVCIDLHLKGVKVNGTSLYAHIKVGSPTNYGIHLNNITAKGYLRRDGRSKFVPIRKPDGSELETIITVLPPGEAKNNKPWSQKLGDIARVK